MKTLISIARLIQKQRIKNLDIILSRHIKGKSRVFYDGILCNKIIDLESAMLVVYGKKVKLKTINQLKSRLENKLFNSLFFIDLSQPNFVDYRKALHEVSKNYFLTIILLERTERNAGIKIAEKAFKKAYKFEITEFALGLCRILIRHYAFLEPNQKKFSFFSLRLEGLKQNLFAEILAEQYYSEISNYQARKRESFDQNKMMILKKYCEELRPMQRAIKSKQFNLDTYQICLFYHLKMQEYNKVVELCHEALAFFDSKPFNYKLAEVLIKNDLIVSSIHLKNFAVAEEYINQNLSEITSGSFNWYKFLNYQFINFSVQCKFNELLQITHKIFDSSHLKSFSIHYESWLIKEAYVQFLIKIGKVDNDHLEKYPLRPFRLNRFLNDLPLYSKDKRGLNISILIIQVLFLIQQKKFDQVIDRMDALQQYTYRYLRNDETYRSNCFIKMLLKIPDAGFNPIRTQRHVENLHKKLLATSMEISDQSSEIEVIPYENLWEMVIELLEKVKS